MNRAQAEEALGHVKKARYRIGQAMLELRMVVDIEPGGKEAESLTEVLDSLLDSMAGAKAAISK